MALDHRYFLGTRVYGATYLSGNLTDEALGLVGSTIPRMHAVESLVTGASIFANNTLTLVAIPLIAGITCSGIAWVNGTPGWSASNDTASFTVGIYKQTVPGAATLNLALAAQTPAIKRAGNTYSMFAADTQYSCPLVASYTPSYSGLHWVGVAVKNDTWAAIGRPLGIESSFGSVTRLIPTPAKSGDPVGWNTYGCICIQLSGGTLVSVISGLDPSDGSTVGHVPFIGVF